jgi:hypothetical protein
MSDYDDRESGKMGAFLLGFLVGVLVCLGGGATFYAAASRQSTMQAREAMMMADMARAEAEAARLEAEKNRERAVKAVEEFAKAKEKEKPKE